MTFWQEHADSFLAMGFSVAAIVDMDGSLLSRASRTTRAPAFSDAELSRVVALFTVSTAVGLAKTQGINIGDSQYKLVKADDMSVFAIKFVRSGVSSPGSLSIVHARRTAAQQRGVVLIGLADHISDVPTNAPFYRLLKFADDLSRRSWLAVHAVLLDVCIAVAPLNLPVCELRACASFSIVFS